MLKEFQAIIIGTIGIFTAAHAQQNVSQSTSLQLKDILTVQNSNGHAGSVTITPGGAVHFLKASFFSDSNCFNLMGNTASIIDNMAGFPFTSGQTVNLNSSSAYQLATNVGINANQVKCIGLYLDGGNASNAGISCAQFTESCAASSCTTASGTPSLAWAANNNLCEVSYAYISNNDSLNGVVTKCQVNSVSGHFQNCINTTLSSPPSANQGIASNNGNVWIGYNPSNTISVCLIDSSTGNLSISSCQSSQASGVSSKPTSIAINQKYAYILGQSGSLTKCQVNPLTGILSNCISGSVFGSPANSIVFNFSPNVPATYAYGLAGSNTNQPVTKCTVATSGNLNSCAPITVVQMVSPSGMAFNNGYAYITDSDNTQNNVTKCTVDTSGNLTSCAVAASGFSTPIGIVFPNNGYAYIANQGNNTVSQCTVDVTTGNLSACSVTGSGYVNPQNITIF